MAGIDKKKSKRYPMFRIQMNGDEDLKTAIFEKLEKAKNQMASKLGQAVTNAVAVSALLDHFLGSTDRGSSVKTSNVFCSKKSTGDEVFLMCKSSLTRALQKSSNHGRYCTGKLRVTKFFRNGHAAILTVECRKLGKSKNAHKFCVSSSPKLPDDEYLVNQRVAHGYIFSGMRPSHYERFAETSGIGKLSDQRRLLIYKSYSQYILEEYQHSISNALEEEIKEYPENQALDAPSVVPVSQEEANNVSNTDEQDHNAGASNVQAVDTRRPPRRKIRVATDARHGFRKNSQDTSVVAIGEKTRKVIDHEHVCKEDDHVAQRHELIGTRRFYEYMDSKDVQVDVHCHDRNMSINKFVRTTRDGSVTNQNDVWHGLKTLKKNVAVVASGPKKYHGTKWHNQLEDKTEPIGTHASWAVKHCGGSKATLQELLINSVEHYKNNHEKCHETSRCKTDSNYEPSRIVITDEIAEKLLTDAIKKSSIYAHAEDFVLNMDTYSVEGFNNVMNKFHDKRIAYGSDTYVVRSHISVLDWNENVGRAFTSIYQPKRANRQGMRKQGTKTRVKPTQRYTDKVWKRYIRAVYVRRR